MQLNLIHKTAVFILITLALLFTAAALQGCRWARDVDEAFWQSGSRTTTQIDPATGKEVTTIETDSPPLLTLLASSLSLAGFGGLAAWLKKVNTNGKKLATSTDDRIKDLEEELAKLFDEVVAIRVKNATPRPSEN